MSVRQSHTLMRRSRPPDAKYLPSPLTARVSTCIYSWHGVGAVCEAHTIPEHNPRTRMMRRQEQLLHRTTRWKATEWERGCKIHGHDFGNHWGTTWRSFLTDLFAVRLDRRCLAPRKLAPMRQHCDTLAGLHVPPQNRVVLTARESRSVVRR